MKNETLEKIFNAYRITKKGNITIVDNSSGKYVIKKENKDLFSLFSYLENRSYIGVPKLIKKINNENVFEYVEDRTIPLGQKVSDLAISVGLLHSKTVYFKNVSIDNYKEIKENIESNNENIHLYYESLFLKFLKEEHLSPDKYLFLVNYTSILNIYKYINEYIDSWYNLVIDKDKIRVCVNHNNLELDHFINNDKNILVSWDKYLIDTPVVDLTILFKNECLNIDYTVFLNKYLDIFNLTDDELLLFKLLICVIPKVNFDDTIFKNTQKVKELFMYINEVNKLIWPNNFKEKEE